MKSGTTYESLFERYRDDSAILRMEKYAFWSLPSLFVDPDLGQDGRQQPVERDYQSVGALLTNSLSSKLAGLLFPPNQSFFRLDAAVDTSNTAEALGVSADDLNSGLADLENKAYRRMFLRASYAQVTQGLKLAVVTGNALLYRDSKNQTIHTYSLRSYSLKRDGSGKVLDIILKEYITIGQIPAELAQHFAGRDEMDTVPLWTRIKRKRGEVTDSFEVTQQIECYDLAGMDVFPEAVCPYIPVTWNLITGEDYGRGLVEDYAGDFAKLSSLSESLALYEIEAARVLHLAAPGSGGDIDMAASSDSGQWLQMDPDKVKAYEAGDYQKIQALLEDLQSIIQRLAPAFMWTGNVRDAERVTAEEIRMQAEEADKAMGGNYSSLADNLHIPLAHILCNEVDPQFVGEMIGGGLTLSVLTGVAALGRSADVNKLLQVSQVLAAVLPVLTAQGAGGRFDPNRIAEKVFEGFGLDISEYQFTEDELKAQAAQDTQEAAAGANPELAGVANTIGTSGVIA